MGDVTRCGQKSIGGTTLVVDLEKGLWEGFNSSVVWKLAMHFGFPHGYFAHARKVMFETSVLLFLCPSSIALPP